VGRVQVGGGIFLALSCKKDSFGKLNSLKDRRCFMRCLSLFFLFAKEPMGISGTKLRFSVDNPVP